MNPHLTPARSLEPETVVRVERAGSPAASATDKSAAPHFRAVLGGGRRALLWPAELVVINLEY
jgi:hypothetical protein